MEVDLRSAEATQLRSLEQRFRQTVDEAVVQENARWGSQQLTATLEVVGGSLRRVIPIVLAHHDRFDGSGYHATKGHAIPLEARVIAVADVYDSLTSDRPYRKAMSPFDAKDIIEKGAGSDFDPMVVEAFLAAFRNGDLDVRLPSAAVA